MRTHGYQLTRRKVLAGLGAVGLGSAGAGFGSSAYFSDEETYKGNILVAAGTDLLLDWQQTVLRSPPVDVNAYPDPDGDGVQSLGGVNFSGATGTLARPFHIPDVCGNCGDGQIGLRQGSLDVCIDVVRGEESVTEFYNYQAGPAFSSGNTAIQAGDASRVFFYEEPGGDRYFVVIHGEYEDGSGGNATFAFEGLEEAAGSQPWLLQDDDASYEPDEYSAAEATWGWVDGKTDGGVAGPLTAAAGHDGFCITIDPTINGVSALQVLDGASDAVIDLDPETKFTFCSETGLENVSALTPQVFQSPEAPQQEHLVELTDVKPGDAGRVDFSIHSCDLETYVWFFADNVVEAENGVTEPEAADPQEDGTVDNPGSDPELAELIDARVWYDENCDEFADGEEVFLEGSLREVLSILSQTNENGVPGVPLDGDPSTGYDEVVGGTVDDGVSENRDCIPPKTTICVGFEWSFPENHSNQAQTDSVTFDLGFYSEQCTANDGSGQGPEDG